MSVLSRIQSLGNSQKAGVAALVVGVAGALVWAQLATAAPGGLGGGQGGTSLDPSTGVELNATLSQPKIVQGGDGTIYLDLSVATPETGDARLRRKPTDMIVVLDRSGSMGEGDKWRYATQAVHSMLDRLAADDRVSLITFDTNARVDSPLVDASPENIAELHALVKRLGPGDSTNLGDALLAAEKGVSRRSHGKRLSRVLLLSDGQANAGIVDPEALGAIARRLSDRGAVVSTIGMGLGFNETLMASLADLGMGSFSYLEHLDSLAVILAKELSDSRSVFAEGSEIRVELPSGVKLVEASGYPFSFEGNSAVIRTGQLLRGSRKQFMSALRVSSQSIAEYPIGVELRYRQGERSYRQRIRTGQLQVACIPPEREPEAIASIDRDVYRDAWIQNNLGEVMRKVGDYVRSGEKEMAAQSIEEFRSRLDEADAVVPGLKKEGRRELKDLEDQVDRAFTGPDQRLKQNRAAKALLNESQARQRTVQKNQ